MRAAFKLSHPKANKAIGVSHIPGRKRFGLYTEEGNAIHIHAWFISEKSAQHFKQDLIGFLKTFADVQGNEEI